MPIGRPPKQVDLTKLSNENFAKILQLLEGRLSKIVEAATFIRYEFVLMVQTRDAHRRFYKTIERPSMPLVCDDICISQGWYKIHKITVDMDERLIRVCLNPQVINRIDPVKEKEAYEQFVNELLEAGWNE